MRYWIGAILMMLLLGVSWLGCPVRAEAIPQTRATTQAVRFGYVDILVDPGGVPLAAYQFELKATESDATIVGVEGGDVPAFRDAPFYDPQALKQGRIIIAAYSTSDALPAGAVRVARVHLQIAGPGRPIYQVRLMAAGDREGNAIRAIAAIREGDHP